MAFSLIEQHAQAQVFASSANTRRRLLRSFSAPQWAQDPSTGLYVDFAGRPRGQSGNLRSVAVSANFDAIRETGEKIYSSNGFSLELARERPGLEEDVGGTYVDVPLVMQPYAVAPRGGREASYVAYSLNYVGDRVDMDHLVESNLGWGKGTYTVRARGADVRTYRWKMRLALSASAFAPVFHRSTAIISNQLVDRGRAFATWNLRSGPPLTLDFSDMVIRGQVDMAASQFDATGVILYSIPFTLAPGQSYTLDPTITPDAGSSGAGAAADSAWGIDGTAGNTTAVGIVGGVHNLCNYNRFSTSPIASGDTLNSGTYEPYVGDVGLFSSSTADYGGYNGDARGNPGSGSYASEYPLARVVTNADSYAGVGTSYQSTGRKTFTLPAGALTDFAAALTDGFVVICNQGNGVSGNQYVFLTAHNNTTAGNRPFITLDYTAGGGGGISIPVVQGYRRMMGMR